MIRRTQLYRITMPVLEKKCLRSGCPAVLKLPRIKRLTIMLSKKF